MRQSRIYTTQTLNVGDSLELETRAGHYLANVLRISAGKSVILFNGDGKDYTCEVQTVRKQQVTVSLLESHICNTESPLHLTLAQAISKGERMDYSVQKAAELGVAVFQPLFSRRVAVKLDAKREEKRLAHWQAVAISACEQSGRARVPTILEPMSLVDWLAADIPGERLVLAPEATCKLSGFKPSDKRLSLLIGPEGGFEDDEVQQACRAGCIAVSMGPRILRTETAGPVAMALLQAIAGDF
jgi:16S rRNA (uracil1498-N3)-methyltransferase